MSRIYLIFLMLGVLLSCTKEETNKKVSNAGKSQDSSVQKSNLQDSVSKDTGPTDFNTDNYGNYVDGSYNERSSGADWVSVRILPYTKGSVMVSVRSRADKMKPSCTYDGIASIIGENELKSNESVGTMVLRFKNNKLTISAEGDSKDIVMTYFCRGGGSLAGTYQRINDELDQSQIDKTAYTKTLSLKGSDITFFIEVTGKKMTITPAGLKADNKPITHTIDGFVNDAEIADLNVDGSPEIYINTVSEGTGRFGNVIGYSVNNGKSLSQINFPNINDNKEAAEGYGGKDDFAVVENTLVRRFPVFKPEDANAAPSGGTKQIQYKLKQGEAGWQLVIDKIVSY